MFKINTFTDVATYENFGLDLSSTSQWHGGVLGADGYIYGIPYNSTSMLRMAPHLGIYEITNFGTAFSGTAKFNSGVTGIDGATYLIPTNPTYLAKVKQTELTHPKVQYRIHMNYILKQDLKHNKIIFRGLMCGTCRKRNVIDEKTE